MIVLIKVVQVVIQVDMIIHLDNLDNNKHLNLKKKKETSKLNKSTNRI